MKNYNGLLVCNVELTSRKIKMNNKYYVYIYLDPRKPGNYQYGDYHFDYVPFYIGKGKNNRYLDHLKFHIKWYNYHLRNRIISIRKDNKEPIVIKIKENLLDKESQEIEILLIKLIGRRDLNKGTLVNMTDGGDGSSGHIVTKEQIEKHMKTWKSPFLTKTLEEMVGWERAKEIKSSTSERMKENNPIKIPRVREQAIKNITSLEAKRKCSEYRKTPEARLLRSINIQGNKNPVIRFSEKNIFNNKDFQLKQKIRVSGKGNPMAKWYLITYPDGKQEKIKCLNEFCRTHSITKYTIYNKRKGWDYVKL